jgi:predicted AAA+ superfamily ATPase
MQEESLPYLMLSKRAFENGISSVTIEQLLKVLQDTYNIKTTGEDDSSGERKKKEKKTGSST